MNIKELFGKMESKTMGKNNNLVKYFWQIIYSHTIAYFIAGIFALAVVNYRALFETEIMSSFMRAVDEPIVALGGTFLQLFRGIIIALIILPLRKVFLEEKHGLIRLGIIIFGFSLLSTIGPTIGSFEGYVYTKMPVMYQILGYPEAIIYIMLFIGLLGFSKRYGHKKIVTIISIIIIVLLSLMGIMGFIMAKK
jgi:hypothetical protein